MTAYALSSSDKTEQFGAALAALLLPGDVVTLTGDLGAGKTTLTRGLICALCGAGTEVPSPTYTLVQTYPFEAFPVWHFDLYRLDTPDDIFELGWTETASGVAILEWPERAMEHMPRYRLNIRLETVGDARKAILEPFGEDWQTRLDGFEF